jgi:hypothetical protein
VERRVSAPQIGVIEAGKVVVDQRRAMQQFDGSGCRVGKFRIGFPAGAGYGNAQRGAKPTSTGKHGVTQSRRQNWRATAGCGLADCIGQRIFDPRTEGFRQPCGLLFDPRIGFRINQDSVDSCHSRLLVSQIPLCLTKM